MGVTIVQKVIEEKVKRTFDSVHVPEYCLYMNLYKISGKGKTEYLIAGNGRSVSDWLVQNLVDPDSPEMDRGVRIDLDMGCFSRVKYETVRSRIDEYNRTNPDLDFDLDDSEEYDVYVDIWESTYILGASNEYEWSEVSEALSDAQVSFLLRTKIAITA